MKKIRLVWTISELKSFIQLFGHITVAEIGKLRADPQYYLAAYVVMGLAIRLTDTMQTAKMLGRQQVRVAITTAEVLAIYALIDAGRFDFVQEGTYEENILMNLKGIIHQKYYM